jgi:serine/threonine-protein kinase
MQPGDPPPRVPAARVPEERRTQVIEESGPPHPPGPPRRPPWQRGWWLLGLFGLAVLAGAFALIYLANDDEDGDAGPSTTVTTTAPETTTTTPTDTDGSPTTTTEPEPEPEPVAVPDAVGRDHVEAGAAVDDAGLIANTVPVPSQEPQGTVVAQSPRAGTQLDEGSPVQLNVSLGPDPPAEAQVPDLTGPGEREARATCREANFTCVTRDTAAPSSEEVGEVVDQEPAAGTSAETLTQITLFVGR